MLNENNFSNINKINDISQKKEYSDEEIKEKLAQGVDLDNDFALYLLESINQDKLIYNLEKFQGLNHQEIALKLVQAAIS